MTENFTTNIDKFEVTLNGKQISIEVVDKYKYLGMWISKNNRYHLEQLIAKGKQAAYLTAKQLKEFGQVSGEILKNTFEMLALSRMKYCAEFCFFNNLKSLDQIQYQFYKRYYHLKPTTPNYCLIGEFGIRPMDIHFYKAAICLWIRLITKDGNSLIKQVYNAIYLNMISNGNESRYTWCWRINRLLTKLNLSKLWDEQLTADKKAYLRITKDRICQYNREKWISTAKESHSGLTYLELCQFEETLKSYLNFDIDCNDINMLLKFRTKNHKLDFVTGSYRNRLRYEERLCELCNESKVETLYHFMIECPLYQNMRQQIAPLLCYCNTIVEFHKLMNTLTPKHLKSIARFLKKANELRMVIKERIHHKESEI